MDGDACAPEDCPTCARRYPRARNFLEHGQFSGTIDEAAEVFDVFTPEDRLPIVNDLRP